MTTLPSLDLGLGPAPRPDLGFVYVGDPMCSWCWGFAPALEQLERRYGLPLKVVMGGLRTGPQAELMDADARAQLAMRELSPDDTLRWVARLHRAFYVDGVDITDPTQLPTLVDGFDVDPQQFAALLADEATTERTRDDFREAQAYGATGFPTLLLRDGEELGIVTRGYVPWEQLEPALTRWLEDRYGDLTAGLACDPTTGPC